jgi:malate dehydrogenase
VRSLINDTPANDWHSLALCSKGEYGAEKGLICSFPIRVKAGKAEVLRNVPTHEFSRGKIDASVNELKEKKSLVGDLLGVP